MSLQQIQERLKAPKSQNNSFGNYKYRSLEDILNAVKPLLAEQKYSLVISDCIQEIGGRVYVKAITVLTDEAGKIVAENTAFAREPLLKKGMDEAQITGATSSYARKYALNGLFAIDDTKDADSMNNAESHQKQQLGPEPPPAPKSKKDIPPGERLLNMKTQGYEDLLREAYLACGEDELATDESLPIIKGVAKQKKVLEAALKIMKEQAGVIA